RPGVSQRRAEQRARCAAVRALRLRRDHGAAAVSVSAERRRSLLRVRAMRSERWQAHGNVYLVTEDELTADGVRAVVGDADGVAQVIARGDDWADVVIWNPDGSTVEMSGNATRIVAAW